MNFEQTAPTFNESRLISAEAQRDAQPERTELEIDTTSEHPEPGEGRRGESYMSRIKTLAEETLGEPVKYWDGPRLFVPTTDPVDDFFYGLIGFTEGQADNIKAVPSAGPTKLDA